MRLLVHKKEIENKNDKNNKKYKIIVVDNELEIIESLNIFFEHSGHTLVCCANPYEAIEKVKNEHFDLMILDFMVEALLKKSL